MNTISHAKRSAKILRKALSGDNINLAHSACLEIVAQQMGYKSWNILSARSSGETNLSINLFVAHGQENEAATFYSEAFGAVEVFRHFLSDQLTAVDLHVGETMIRVAGSNPRREDAPALGGPFHPKEKGSVSTVFTLEISDLDHMIRQARDAGASIRFEPDICPDGRRAASLFDPYGHIWALTERTGAARQMPRRRTNT